MKTIRLFGREICIGDRQALSAHLAETLATHRKSVFFCNVHMLMLSLEDQNLASAMASADIIFADGVPVAWLQRRLGARDADVLRGYEAVELVCRQAADTDAAIGFLGSTDVVLQKLTANLEQKHKGLSINYIHSPGQINEDMDVDTSLVEQINAKQLYCLFIGLGCPKQEKWVSRYGPHLDCNLLAVGAAFDWLAGTTKKPPGWMERAGLAWLFRLFQSPGKMWHRYLIYNTKFMIMATKPLLWGRPKSERRGGMNRK